MQPTDTNVAILGGNPTALFKSLTHQQWVTPGIQNSYGGDYAFIDAVVDENGSRFDRARW